MLNISHLYHETEGVTLSLHVKSVKQLLFRALEENLVFLPLFIHHRDKTDIQYLLLGNPSPFLSQ